MPAAYAGPSLAIRQEQLVGWTRELDAGARRRARPLHRWPVRPGQRGPGWCSRHQPGPVRARRRARRARVPARGWEPRARCWSTAPTTGRRRSATVRATRVRPGSRSGGAPTTRRGSRPRRRTPGGGVDLALPAQPGGAPADPRGGAGLLHAGTAVEHRLPRRTWSSVDGFLGRHLQREQRPRQPLSPLERRPAAALRTRRAAAAGPHRRELPRLARPATPGQRAPLPPVSRIGTASGSTNRPLQARQSSREELTAQRCRTGWRNRPEKSCGEMPRLDHSAWRWSWGSHSTHTSLGDRHRPS